MGKMATSPLPYRRSPPLQSGGQSQKWPTSGQIGYLTPAVSGIPTAANGGKIRSGPQVGKLATSPLPYRGSRRCRAGGKIRSGPQVGKLATSPLPYRGSPPLQMGAKSEVAHKWANWLPHPCRIGDSRRCRAGGKIRSGPQVGKLATSPLPYRGSPPLQSGGQNQKWPTRGQIGYLTPAVSGIPTAAERGAKSEVAHKWANWLPHPCRIGDPRRCRAGGRIRSGPQVGKLATSPLPYRGSPPLQMGAKSEVAHKWANWLPHPCRIGDPHRCRAGGKIRSGPQVGKLATSPLPYRGSPPLQSGGQNQKWPTSGQIGYLTPAVSGIPTAAERGAKSEVAHKWAKWLPHPCRIGDPRRCRAGGRIRSGPQVGKLATSPLPYRGSPPLQMGAKSEVAHKWANWLPHPCRIGDPHRCRAGGKIRSGPQVGKLATSPLPYRGSPPLQSGGQNQKWPTSGQIGYLTPAVSGSPTAAERGAKSEVAHKWAKWLPHPCRIGDPRRCRAGGKIRSGPQVGKLATSPLPYRGSPPLQMGAKSEVAHKWANWLPHPCRIGDPHRCRAGGKVRSGPQVGKLATSPCHIGDPHRCRAGGKIRSGPQVGEMATSPLPYRGSPPLQSGGQNQKWPTSGQIGYLTPAVSGIPTAAERGAKSEVAHKWANWLPHPCRIGDPHRCRAGGNVRSGPQVGKLATSPLPYRGSPPLQSGGQNQKWPTRGQIGYLTPAVSEIPTAAERGAKSEVAHKWANWLPHPCRIGDPHRCGAGGKIRSGPQVGKLATSPLPYRGSPPLQSGGQNQKWPTGGRNGYLTPAVSGIPTAAERGAKSEVAHKWANWLPHPCRIGDPHRCRARGKIRSGPQVGKLATPPLPYRGSPPLQSGGQSQKWPTSGQIGYLTPAVSGIPTAANGDKIRSGPQVGKWLPHPCRIGDPHRCRAGGKIRSGPQGGKLATSPLPIGDPHRFRAGGRIRSGPQVGKLATSPLPYRGAPPPLERGAKSEVAHKWANWLPHPCRIGDPHRCRAGGKIRSGPQGGKLATSPLQSGGQSQKWPTSGQIGYLTPAVSGIPTAANGGKIRSGPQVGKLLPHPCRIGDPHRCRAGGKIRSGPQGGKLATSPLPIGDPHRFRAGGKIRSGPQVGKLATSPLPYRGSPPLQSEGQNQKWPTSGQIGYLTPAVSGIPTAAERGAKSEVAHKWANWLPHPCRIGDPHRCKWGQNQKWPTSGQMVTSPLPYRGSPPLQSGGQNQKWPTRGQIGYLTPAYRGSPPLQSGGQNQKWPTSGLISYLTPAVSGIPTAAEWGAKSEVAHKWAKWLPHPCRIGDPRRCRAGGKIRSGPQVGKLATSPLPYRGFPPLQSEGQNQKWPTSGQIGYLTPAVSGIPTAAERGAKSEVAHKWANWLPHPCRIGDPHRCRAGGKIRSGPQVGKLATSPLPYRGSPPLQSEGQNQKWPTSGQIGYLTPAVSGIPTAAERGAKSEVAHKGANWLPHPCRIGDRHLCRAGGKIRIGPQVGEMATSPLPYRGSPPCRVGGKIRSGPQVGKLATSPLPYRGSPPLQSEGQNQKWPTSGQIGYLTPAVSGIPTAAERGAKSEVAHKWANWLPHPCRIGDPHRCRAVGKIRNGPQVGKLATSPVPYRRSPPLQSGGQNQKWPTSGQIGYLTPAVSGIPTAAERGAKSEVAHKWANWLPHPCRIGDPHRCRAGGKVRSGPQGGEMATSPLPYRGSPPLQSGGQSQKWPTSGQIGYLTPAVSGIPTAANGGKIRSGPQVGTWLPHPCRIGDPHRCRAGGKIRSGPQVGKLATSPLPYRGSPPLQSGGQNQKWPTRGQIGYLTPAVSGIATFAERGAKSELAHKWVKWLPHPCRIGDPHLAEWGAKSEVAHKWANWLPHPCRIGDPHRCRARGKIRSGPQVGKMATSPLPYRGSPPLQSGGQSQKWPTSGQIGYLTPAVSGIPTAAERGAKSEVAHKWANWLPHPCRIGDPHRCRAGGKVRSGPQGGEMATSPLPYRGSPPLQSGGQSQKWPTSGQIGYLTPAVSGIPTAANGGKIRSGPQVGTWLPHPCRIGDPHRCRAGGKIRSGPQVGKLATSPLPYRGSPLLQSGGQSQKWPTSGQNGYLTPAVSAIPAAAERGAKSEVAHKWAKWLPHPCRIGDPHRCRARGKIRSGPQVGKLATSPLPYRGSPPLQSGGQSQKCPTSGQIGYLTPAVSGIPTAAERGAKSEVAHKGANWLPHPCRIGDPQRCKCGQNPKWPTSGQIGYLTPAVSGIPTAAERGAKSEVAHNWANWLPHPCRIGDPHRCRAVGKIRSGPQVGEMATSPLPYRGSPPLQMGAKSEVAHKWANWLPHPCRIGDPPRCRAGGKIRSGPQVVKLATSPLPYRGSPPLQMGAKSEVAHKWANWLPHPCRIGDPHRCRAGGKIRSGPQGGKLATSPMPYRGSPPLQMGAKSEVAHKWANWLPHPCRIGDPHRCRAGGKIRSGPQVGKLATSPLPYRGSPPLQMGAKSEVAHKWANWLPHPCRIGDPHRCRARGKIRSGPQVGKLATSPLPYPGSPPLQSGGQSQKWPTSGQIGYLTPAVSGIPTVANGGKIRSGPQVGKMATSPLPYRRFPPLQSGGQNQKWPTSGQIGYLTPAVSAIPTAAERGAKSEVAHKWANWLPHPCRIGDPHRCRAGGKIRSGPQGGKLATSPLPYRGSPPLQMREKSEVAHKWANWLPHPCRIGDPHRCRAGGKIRSGPQLGKLATSPLPYRRVRPVAAATRPGRPLGSEVQPVRGRRTTAIPSVPPTPRPAAPCPLDRWRRTTTKGSGCPDGAPHR